MRVAQAARDLNVSADWIRRMERRGVLPLAPRDRNGHRRYDVGLIAQIRTVLYRAPLTPIPRGRRYHDE